ncbi:MAG: hypothetical protein COA43_00515 [Robiginitomaculum sp.]|nr:MAG: hypothetical protein COA43_00515 [Robiginitomaculum sp.]
MNANNIAIITGRIATDITVRGSDEKPVVSTLIITQDGYYDQSGQWIEKTSAIPVTFFGPAAKRAKAIVKGDEWTLTGKMQSDQYTNKDGVDVRTMELQLQDPSMLQIRRNKKHTAKKAA